MSKIFVLRVRSLLSSEDSTQRFGSDNEVVIPEAVIDELRNYRGRPEKKKTAECILNYIESFDIVKLYGKGVKQANGSILKIARNFHDIEINMEGINELDRRVFQVCLGLKKENPKKRVILISKEPVIRIKARSIGILSEDFKDDLFPAPEEQYSGRISIETTSKGVDKFFKDKYLDLSEVLQNQKIEWIKNMFVEAKAVDANQSFIGRYDGEKIVPLIFSSTNPYGVIPKNVGQRILLECLLTDWETAPLVIAKGSAGTGKTFCSLAASLKQIEENQYNRVLIAAPSETVGKEELGFLPGELDNKMSPYLGGLYDNLSILINGRKNQKSNAYTEKGEYYFEKEIIQIQAIGFLRGRTIVNTIFIIDETQNIEPSILKTIVTRAAEGSKFVFLGDPTQVDNPKLNERYNGLVYLSEKFKDNPLCYQMTFKEGESVRGKLSSIASKIL